VSLALAACHSNSSAKPSRGSEAATRSSLFPDIFQLTLMEGIDTPRSDPSIVLKDGDTQPATAQLMSAPDKAM
jgi:hypothetical protein